MLAHWLAALVAWASLSFLSPVASAQQGLVTPSQLSDRAIATLGGVRSVVLAIEAIPGASDAGIDTIQLRTAVELRLREGGISIADSTEGAPARVYLNVNLLKARDLSGLWVYSLNLEVQEDATTVRRPALNVSAATWQARGTVGYAGQEQVADGVERAVSAMIDEFLNAWLTANPSGRR